MSSGRLRAVSSRIGRHVSGGEGGQALLLRLTAQTLTDLDAVKPRHHHVEADEIGCVRRHGSQGGWPVDRLDDVVALPRQQLVQQGKVRRLVVDRKDQRPVAHQARYPATLSTNVAYSIGLLR